jgi:integrase
MRSAGIPVPDVNLPQVPPSDEDFLDFEQIQTFLRAIRGDDAECAALLMLHSLRTSELLMLDASDVRDGVIHVRGAIVQDKDNNLVEKKTNKNRTSTRDIPVMIPRLLEVLPVSGKAVTVSRATFRRHIMDACTANGLPACSPHDLRRTFASLAKHLKWDPVTVMRVGGWSNMQTVNRIYAKLAEKDRTADIERMQNYYQITTEPEKSREINWYTPMG